MSNQRDKTTDEDSQPTRKTPPDNRGPRPTDPNALAKWIVDQTTRDDDDDGKERVN